MVGFLASRRTFAEASTELQGAGVRGQKLQGQWQRLSVRGRLLYGSGEGRGCGGLSVGSRADTWLQMGES